MDETENNSFWNDYNRDTSRYLTETLNRYPSLTPTLLGANGEMKERTKQTIIKINTLAHMRAELPTQTIDYLFSHKPADISLLFDLIPDTKRYVCRHSAEIDIVHRSFSENAVHS